MRNSVKTYRWGLKRGVNRQKIKRQVSQLFRIVLEKKKMVP